VALAGPQAITLNVHLKTTLYHQPQNNRRLVHVLSFVIDGKITEITFILQILTAISKGKKKTRKGGKPECLCQARIHAQIEGFTRTTVSPVAQSISSRGIITNSGNKSTIFLNVLILTEF